MRSSVLVGLSAAVVAVALTGPGASASNRQNDMIAGTAHFDQYNPRVDVHVNATSDSDGGNARGWWRYDSAGGGAYDHAGKVTCLNVYGNSAVISGLITKGDLTGTYFQQFVQDVGSPGDEGDNSVTLLTGVPQDPGCAAHSGGGILATGGNYVVKDAV